MRKRRPTIYINKGYEVGITLERLPNKNQIVVCKNGTSDDIHDDSVRNKMTIHNKMIM